MQPTPAIALCENTIILQCPETGREPNATPTDAFLQCPKLTSGMFFHFSVVNVHSKNGQEVTQSVRGAPAHYSSISYIFLNTCSALIWAQATNTAYFFDKNQRLQPRLAVCDLPMIFCQITQCPYVGGGERNCGWPACAIQTTGLAVPRCGPRLV